MIVVDASAALLGLVDDGAARRLLASESLATSCLADAEVANGLRSLGARGRVDDASAVRALDTWARLGIERWPIAPGLPRIWELRANLTAYDAAYVALAEALQCPVVTADSRLASAPGPVCEFTVVRS